MDVRRKLSLDRRGVALPMALLALVVVSLLLTTALMTTSTEGSISLAHQDATRRLYGAEAALEGFVADVALQSQTASLRVLSPGSYPRTVAGEPFNIIVSRLEETVTGVGESAETYALIAEPQNGGRSVGALLSTARTFVEMDNNIDEGVATGGGIRNSGNSKISAFSDLCENPDGSGVAVRFTNDVSSADKAQLDMSKIEGDTATLTDVSSSQLINHALNGATKEDVFAYATIRFGYDGQPAFDESKKPNAFDYLIGDPYNWGCPEKLLATATPDCSTSQPGSVGKVPVIAIEAGGRTLGLQGHHGQGILYISGGNLKITGKFVFYGIIIIDGGHFEISGTGTEGTKIEGSLLSTGGVKDSRISGDAVVNYNSCAVDYVEDAFNKASRADAPQAFKGTTFGWFEVIR